MVPMRRSDRRMEQDEAYTLLRTCSWATLSMVNARSESPLGLGSPYAIPISPVEWKGSVYFHCAKAGHKIDNLKADGRVCLTCVGHALPDEPALSVAYASVVVFAEAKEVKDEQEKTQVLLEVCKKFAPSQMDGMEKYIATMLLQTAVWKLEIAGYSGKQRKFE